MSCRLMKQTKCLINKSFVTYGQFYSRQNASVEVKNFSSSSRLSIFNQRRPNKVIDGKNDEDDEDFMFSVKGMQQEDDQEEADLNSAYKAAIKMRSEKQEKKVSFLAVVLKSGEIKFSLCNSVYIKRKENNKMIIFHGELITAAVEL